MLVATLVMVAKRRHAATAVPWMGRGDFGQKRSSHHTQFTPSRLNTTIIQLHLPCSGPGYSHGCGSLGSEASSWQQPQAAARVASSPFPPPPEPRSAAHSPPFCACHGAESPRPAHRHRILADLHHRTFVMPLVSIDYYRNHNSIMKASSSVEPIF